MRQHTGKALVIYAVLAVTSIASADNWVHVNFGPTTTGLVGPTGVGSGETWNQQAGTGTSNATALQDSTGVDTTIGWSFTGGSFSSSAWTKTLISMLKGALWVGDGNSRTMTLSGLKPASKYALYIASYNQNSWGSTTMSFSTANTTTTSSPQLATPTTEGVSWVLNNNYVVFEEMVPDGSGNITVSGVKTAGSYGFWSGFQLKETPAPPSGTMITIK